MTDSLRKLAVDNLLARSPQAPNNDAVLAEKLQLIWERLGRIEAVQGKILGSFPRIADIHELPGARSED